MFLQKRALLSILGLGAGRWEAIAQALVSETVSLTIEHTFHIFTL